MTDIDDDIDNFVSGITENKPAKREDASEIVEGEIIDGELVLPEVPESFDIEIIKKQALSIMNNPSLSSRYFQALWFKFNTASYRKVLRILEEYNRAVASGIDSQTEINRKKQQLIESEMTLLRTEKKREELLEELDRTETVKEDYDDFGIDDL